MAQATNVFSQISSPRRSQLIEDQIKESILKGYFKVEERLPSERNLSEQFGVSRAVVREALRSLEKESLITIRTGAQGGAFVRQLNTEPLLEFIQNLFITKQVSHEEIAEARLIIEPNIAAEAAKHANDDDRAKLQLAQNALEQGFRSGDIFLQHNPEPNLHRVISEICGNRMLILLMEVLTEVANKKSSDIKLDKRTQEKITREHAQIIDAISNNDSDLAAEKMQKHLLSVYRNHKELIEKMGNETE